MGTEWPSVSGRALRQYLSVYLRRVTQGETLQVTDCGRPVALLAPLTSHMTVLDRLYVAGLAAPPAGDLLDVAEPVPGPLVMSTAAALDLEREERLP